MVGNTLQIRVLRAREVTSATSAVHTTYDLACSTADGNVKGSASRRYREFAQLNKVLKSKLQLPPRVNLLGVDTEGRRTELEKALSTYCHSMAVEDLPKPMIQFLALKRRRKRQGKTNGAAVNGAPGIAETQQIVTFLAARSWAARLNQVRSPTANALYKLLRSRFAPLGAVLSLTALFSTRRMRSACAGAMGGLVLSAALVLFAAKRAVVQAATEAAEASTVVEDARSALGTEVALSGSDAEILHQWLRERRGSEESTSQ